MNSRYEDLRIELSKLQERNELAKRVGRDYFEPGKMEYLEQYDSCINDATGEIMMRFPARGTRYEDRTERIEGVRIGDVIQLTRDRKNEYNSNNFEILTSKGKSLGNMPAELCNVIAPLYDKDELRIDKAVVSFVDPISHRNRHAKQAVLFVELSCKLT